MFWWNKKVHKQRCGFSKYCESYLQHGDCGAINNINTTAGTSENSLKLIKAKRYFPTITAPPEIYKPIGIKFKSSYYYQHNF